MAIPAAELKIGQSVRYLIGTRSGMSAAITDISKSSLSIKNTCIVTLAFDDDSLPNHLKTQQLTVYDELLSGCEIITFSKIKIGNSNSSRAHSPLQVEIN